MKGEKSATSEVASQINTYWLREFLCSWESYDLDSPVYRLSFDNQASCLWFAENILMPTIQTMNQHQNSLCKLVMQYAINHFSYQDWRDHTDNDIGAIWISSDPKWTFTQMWDVLFKEDASLIDSTEYQIYYDESEGLWSNKHKYWRNQGV